MILTLQFAKKHGYTHEHATHLCKWGMIPGAQKIGGIWLIPDNAEYKPKTKRGRKPKNEPQDI